MAKKSQVEQSSILYQRLKEAIDRGSQIMIEAGECFYGIPINLDREFVEMIVMVTPDELDEDPDEYQCITWMIRLESIYALAYPMQTWSKEKLENLLKKEAIASEGDN